MTFPTRRARRGMCRGSRRCFPWSLRTSVCAIYIIATPYISRLGHAATANTTIPLDQPSSSSPLGTGLSWSRKVRTHVWEHAAIRPKLTCVISEDWQWVVMESRRVPCFQFRFPLKIPTFTLLWREVRVDVHAGDLNGMFRIDFLNVCGRSLYWL